MKSQVDFVTRVNRRVNRINRKMDKKYPLIASHFYTTFEKEAEKLAKLDIRAEGFSDYLDRMKEGTWLAVEWYKRILMVMELPEIIEETYRFCGKFQLGPEHYADNMLSRITKHFEMYNSLECGYWLWKRYGYLAPSLVAEREHKWYPEPWITCVHYGYQAAKQLELFDE